MNIFVLFKIIFYNLDNLCVKVNIVKSEIIINLDISILTLIKIVSVSFLKSLYLSIKETTVKDVSEIKYERCENKIK